VLVLAPSVDEDGSVTRRSIIREVFLRDSGAPQENLSLNLLGCVSPPDV